MGMMMKVFESKKQAEKYIAEQGGKVQVIYQWDDMRQTIVKTYIVKF